ncbi:DegV family protein with EDD domain [Bacilli bacterium PM5-3]|nr:DegV family protein with EDD domain [Bacilli bacterium PM5-3]MDH6604304.1 DegV family protein with EDD domain [Bacilli bacterium PM5-9]
MEKIAYIMDSSCFLSEKEVRDMDIFYIPLHVVIEGQDFLEGKNLDKDLLLEAIRDKKTITTSQPSPGEILELIKDIKAKGYTCGIFSSIGTGLSKTLDSAIAISATEDFKLYPLDSGSVGNAQTLPLLKVRDLIENKGYDIENALAYVKSDIEQSYTLLLPDDLFHLSRGGRITSAAAALGSMLKIKPILTLVVADGGKIDVIEKVRTAKKAYKKMAELALKDCDVSTHKIIVAHFAGEDKAEELKNELLKINKDLEIDIHELTTVIGVHTGLDSVGVQVCRK